MKCLRCRKKGTRVIDSRPRPDYTIRRRECVACGLRFSTHEIPAAEDELQRKILEFKDEVSQLERKIEARRRGK